MRLRMMANPLYAHFQNQKNEMLMQLKRDAMGLRDRFQNPQAEVERLLKSGQMSQSQFNQYQQIARNMLSNGFLN